MHPVRSYSFLAASRRAESSSSTSEAQFQIAPSATLRSTNTLLSGDPQLVVLDPQQDFIPNLDPHCFPKSRRESPFVRFGPLADESVPPWQTLLCLPLFYPLPLMNKPSTQSLVRHRTLPFCLTHTSVMSRFLQWRECSLYSAELALTDSNGRTPNDRTRAGPICSHRV